MVINLSATTAFVVKAAPVGVTTTILLDKNKTKEQKTGTFVGMGVATSISALIQSCTRQASAEAYVESLTDEQLAYVSELIDAKESELTQAELGLEIPENDVKSDTSSKQTENVLIKTK